MLVEVVPEYSKQDEIYKEMENAQLTDSIKLVSENNISMLIQPSLSDNSKLHKESVEDKNQSSNQAEMNKNHAAESTDVHGAILQGDICSNNDSDRRVDQSTQSENQPNLSSDKAEMLKKHVTEGENQPNVSLSQAEIDKNHAAESTDIHYYAILQDDICSNNDSGSQVDQSTQSENQPNLSSDKAEILKKHVTQSSIQNDAILQGITNNSDYQSQSENSPITHPDAVDLSLGSGNRSVLQEITNSTKATENYLLNSKHIAPTNKDVPLKNKETSCANELNISTPFKKALVWPEEIPKKKKKNNKKIPTVLTSEEWQDYHSKIQEEKERKEREKMERKILRENTKIEKEKEKEAKKAAAEEAKKINNEIKQLLLKKKNIKKEKF